MNMATFTIELLPEERTLVDEITFDPVRNPVDHERNAAIAERLTRSLMDRGGIPKRRLRYFTDADFNIGGRGTSRQGRFERNGCREEDIPRHPNFLRYLCYFIFGADLPDAIRSEFKADVDACGFVTSGDVEPLRKKARTLVRRHGLTAYNAQEELYKLALDCGLSQSAAASIRDAVSTVR